MRAAVINGGGATDFCARFLDAKEKPLKGFTVNVNHESLVSRRVELMHFLADDFFLALAQNQTRLFLRGHSLEIKSKSMIKNKKGSANLIENNIQYENHPALARVGRVALVPGGRVFPRHEFLGIPLLWPVEHGGVSGN